MSTSEFFPDTPKITPEDQIRENERLNLIDRRQNAKAKQALSEHQDNSKEGRLKKIACIYELIGFAQASADRLVETLDPDYDHASNIIITEITSKPSRLPFIKRQVEVYEKREIAVWSVASKVEGIGLLYLGRDGVLYELHSENNNWTYQKIDLPLLLVEDIESLHDSLATMVTMRQQNKES
jgi:hypothetical protein